MPLRVQHLKTVLLGLCALGCQKEESALSAREPAAEAPKTPSVMAAARETGAVTETERPENIASQKDPESPAAKAEPSPPATERLFGKADLDPANDQVVAPPDAVPDCHARLDAAGLKYRPAQLPLKQIVSEIPTCGCHDAVTVTQGPKGMKIVPPATMSCQMALALGHLESLIDELATAQLGEGVRTLHQGGTYSCRKMARFDLVSEHSYGNAIDVFAFTLHSGKKVSVLADFGALDADFETLPPKGKFLRSLASAAYDRDLTSVSLSPYWDALHRDHFHFDMARYRVDGTRPR